MTSAMAAGHLIWRLQVFQFDNNAQPSNKKMCVIANGGTSGKQAAVTNVRQSITRVFGAVPFQPLPSVGAAV